MSLPLPALPGPPPAPIVPAGIFPGGGPTPAFPILTEELGYPPSPSAGGATMRAGAGRNGGLGQTVNKAIQDVLGWKLKPGDPTGFIGALNQSFQLKTVEGAVVSTWTPRSYVVQSDLSGGITGAQASIYRMAKTLVDQTLPLIDGLYPLDPAANLEDVAAVKDLVTSQLTNLCAEIGYLGGPRVIRVQQYLSLLLGVTPQVSYAAGLSNPAVGLPIAQTPDPTSPLGMVFTGWSGFPFAVPAQLPAADYWTDADSVLGSLGDLRDLLGLFSQQYTFAGASTPFYINSIADEAERHEPSHYRGLYKFTSERLGKQHPILRRVAIAIPRHAAGLHFSATWRRQRSRGRNTICARLRLYRSSAAGYIADRAYSARNGGRIGTRREPSTSPDLSFRLASIDSRLCRRRGAGRHSERWKVGTRRGLLGHDISIILTGLRPICICTRKRCPPSHHSAGYEHDAGLAVGV